MRSCSFPEFWFGTPPSLFMCSSKHWTNRAFGSKVCSNLPLLWCQPPTDFRCPLLPLGAHRSAAATCQSPTNFWSLALGCCYLPLPLADLWSPSLSVAISRWPSYPDAQPRLPPAASRETPEPTTHLLLPAVVNLQSPPLSCRYLPLPAATFRWPSQATGHRHWKKSHFFLLQRGDPHAWVSLPLSWFLLNLDMSGNVVSQFWVISKFHYTLILYTLAAIDFMYFGTPITSQFM